MEEKSIKEIMDETFGVNQIPMRKVSRAEMDELIKEAKERGKTKNKLAGNEKNKEAKENEKEGMDNFPCPRCKEIKWMKLTDGTGRYYCLKCGEVIQFPSTDVEVAKKMTEQHKTPAPASDEIEKKVETVDSIDKPEINKSKELLYCEYRCIDCQEIVAASGCSMDKAKSQTAFHKGCGGKLIFVRQVNPKIAGNKERFSHPRVENAICNGCFHDMGCPRTFKRMVTCLLNNVDYKMKWLRGG